ncbi:sigma-54-dependent Fis family transcriptional regulator [Rhodoblastus acidophilus]|uniref:Sigma-54-dependent Fis family transcriptional regulator n=1 Tax=Candidatus Rhodoblastus alkanivorans TaxID=2954117 RepID=A0ABS9Z1X4_9HYPH|nr:sigma-54-dependent Fis family transcriptional regulator [Candidatus Rhodoblastus alkanivorans]MCI4678019.1 sigma-54-dependent Fis family transcriptional regulator [Candidatus Rhodoblastus alkanivorans]MCI4681641.1 sigma-54-dependent Fis family transcriptional regulator [Candidatus Rhodoblastus alkanivorans]MDI4642688.1 sigma-54-dependent Fis family transcriptional regulator [Rhodoblastus acidophilus]
MAHGAQSDHIDELMRAAAEQNSRRDTIIHESWLRCVAEHKLDPTVLREARILTQGQLRECRDAMDEFLHTARFGVETLYRQVSGLGYVLLLTDASGVTVDFMGDPTFDNNCRRAGLYLGSDWNETHAGTCAVGTCIMTGEALTVHQTDHFDATHIPLTCTAAPIYDPSGKVAAVLDISALRSPEPKASQFLAMQLVKSFAHKIETAHLLNRFRSEWILRLASCPEFADVDPDVVIAVDGAGRVIGVNNQARILMQQEAAASDPSKSPRAFYISDIFECTVDDFPFYVHSRPSEQRGLRLRRSGRSLFGQALPPPKRAPGPAQRERPLPAGLAALAGEDDAMRNVLSRAAKLVNTQMGLLIQGETGAGKEYFTKALHNVSPRAGKPFIAVNCAALPEGLIESELFGHEAGSFTGAKTKGKKGLVLEANGGTLFLDEIGDMPLASQTRLLRVLAERELTPVGATRPIPVDIRVIAATHRDLVELIKSGNFREDLYFRLSGAVLKLPPLRERMDFDWLTEKMLAERRAQCGRSFTLSPAAWARIRQYDWPGNVRELINALDYACAVAEGDLIQLDDLPERILCGNVGKKQIADSAEELLADLRRNRWNVSHVARLRGVDRTTIHRQIRRHGLMAFKHPE